MMAAMVQTIERGTLALSNARFFMAILYSRLWACVAVARRRKMCSLAWHLTSAALLVSRTGIVFQSSSFLLQSTFSPLKRQLWSHFPPFRQHSPALAFSVAVNPGEEPFSVAIPLSCTSGFFFVPVRQQIPPLLARIFFLFLAFPFVSRHIP